MRALKTCGYIFITIFSVLMACSQNAAYAQETDTVRVNTVRTDTVVRKTKKPETAGRQLCIGVDIYHPIINHFLNNQYAYEFQTDYYMRDEYYAAVEAGWGGVNVSYSDLVYTSTNKFLRLGFNKCILTRAGPKDWDMMFMGMRLGFADIDRSNSTYVITDTVWGNKPGTGAGRNFVAVWAELDGGMRVELAKGLFAGWTARGKFLMNGKSFSLVAPLYIAGYGRGDKNAVFDFDVYISYAIRWKRKQEPLTAVKK